MLSVSQANFANMNFVRNLSKSHEIARNRTIFANVKLLMASTVLACIDLVGIFAVLNFGKALVET